VLSDVFELLDDVQVEISNVFVQDESLDEKLSGQGGFNVLVELSLQVDELSQVVDELSQVVDELDELS
jgi:hypothetical protein